MTERDKRYVAMTDGGQFVCFDPRTRQYGLTEKLADATKSTNKTSINYAIEVYRSMANDGQHLSVRSVDVIYQLNYE